MDSAIHWITQLILLVFIRWIVIYPVDSVIHLGHGVGILTFSEKMSQIPHPPNQHIWPNVSKAPTLGRVEVAKIISFRPCCTQVVQPPLTNVGSSFQRLLGIFQDGGFIFRQPRFQGLSLTTWGGKSLGNKIDFQALFIIQDGGHVRFPILWICRMIKIPTLGTEFTVKAPWVARPSTPPPSPPPPIILGLNIDRCII